MFTVFAALIAAGPSAPSGDSGYAGASKWIFSTVQHSEFCPAGNIRLDLRTGRYAFVARAPRRVCLDVSLERPVRTGRLGSKRLAAVRAAYERLPAEGFESEACKDGRHPEEIVISNGGTPILIVSSGAGTGSALDDLTCWSEAATDLHALLDRLSYSLGPSSRP